MGSKPGVPRGPYLVLNPRPGIRPCVEYGVDIRKLFYHRVSAKCGSDFERTQEDFEKFRAILGPVPQDMYKPTVGRLDHSLGYVYDHKRKRWNFEWQDKRENGREGAFARWYGRG